MSNDLSRFAASFPRNPLRDMQAENESSRLTLHIVQKFEYRAISMAMMMVKFFDYSGTSINNAADIRRSKTYLEFLRLIGYVIN